MPLINNITFPIFSKNQNDLNKLRSYFLKITSTSSFIYVPLTTFLILFAPITIEILYGPKWVDMVLPYQILSVYIIFRSITAPASSLYNSLGKPKISTCYNLIFTQYSLSNIFCYLIWVNCYLLYIMIIRCLGALYHIYKSKYLICFTFSSFWEKIRLSIIPSLISFVVTLVIISYSDNHFFSLIFPLLYLAICLIFYKKLLLKETNFILSFITSKRIQ